MRQLRTKYASERGKPSHIRVPTAQCTCTAGYPGPLREHLWRKPSYATYSRFWEPWNINWDLETVCIFISNKCWKGGSARWNHPECVRKARIKIPKFSIEEIVQELEMTPHLRKYHHFMHGGTTSSLSVRPPATHHIFSSFSCLCS